MIGMGRLGSCEMTLASDLDLILIYDAPLGRETSDGPYPLPVTAYFARLSQRLISAITAPTAEGRLYDVDMRLRPSGEAGPIASHFAGFARYQSESAWTWEHMALTRARPVAGDAGLRRRISETVAAVLRSPRDPEKLLIDVAAMRRRVAEENRRPSPWDLRNRGGGLIDLEFILQYLMLRHAASSSQILRRGTAEAITALGKARLLSPQAQHELGEAAALFRNVQAVLTLLGDGSPSTALLPELDAAALAACVGAVDFARLDADITAAAACVSSWYDRLVEQPARQAVQARGDDPR